MVRPEPAQVDAARALLERLAAVHGLSQLRHGDEFAGGVRIVEILADGVILQHDGRRFVLPRD